jgi:hypothetical protein
MRVEHVASKPVVEALQDILRDHECEATDVASIVDVAGKAWKGPVSFSDMGATGTLPKFHTTGNGENYCIVFVLVLVLEMQRVLVVAQDPACTRERREEVARSMHAVSAFLSGLCPARASTSVQANAIKQLVTLATRVVDVMARRAERVGGTLEQFKHFERTGCMAIRDVAYLGVRRVDNEGGRVCVEGGLGVCTWFTRLAEVAAIHVMEVLLEFGPSVRGPRYGMQVLVVSNLCLLLSQLWREAEQGQSEESGALYGFQHYWALLLASKLSVEWQRPDGFGSRSPFDLKGEGHTYKDWFQVGPRFLVAWWTLAGVALGLAEEAGAYRPEWSQDLQLLGTSAGESCVSNLALGVSYLTRILPAPEDPQVGAAMGAAMQAARQAVLDLCSSTQGMTRAVLPRKTTAGFHIAGASPCLAFEDVWEDPRTHGPALEVAAGVVLPALVKKGRRGDGVPLHVSGLEAKAMCMVLDLVRHGLGTCIVKRLSDLWGPNQTMVNPDARVNCWGTSTRLADGATYDRAWDEAVRLALAMDREWSVNRWTWIHAVVRASILRRSIQVQVQVRVRAKRVCVRGGNA